MAIKLDMAKAYNRVEWDFLIGMMVSLGFAPLFCSWIKECISTISFSVLINGSPTGLERGALHGFKISPIGVPLTHLFFADDSVVFGDASVEEVKSIVEVLKTYARGSGQEINLAKSSVFFGANTPKCMKAKIVDTLGIQCKQGFGKYLGLQADFGHSKKAVFAEIRDKIEARMSGWAEQYLSQAGKETLVKTVAMALPNFAMSCFKLPIGVCRDIERAIRNYWWRGNEQRKGIHWISWDRLMKQKKAGGLGFKDIQCVNLAFLAKIGWQITQNPLSLLASILKDKYFPGKTFGEAPKRKNTSWARKVLQLGLRWQVGNGKSINIRKDPWFPKPSTFKVKPKANLEGTKVSDLIDPATNSWRTEKISNGFNRDDVLPILSIPLSQVGIDDRLVWHYTTNGVYLVKFGYGLAINLMEDGALGRKGRGAPNESNKLNLHMRIDNVCGVCNTLNETENHLFFRYEISHVFWFASPLHLNSHVLEGSDFLESWSNFCGQVKDRINADEICQDFAFGLWRLWKNRNDVSTSEYKGSLARDSDDYSPRLSKTIKDSEITYAKWQKPRFGSIKINTDAASCKSTMHMGVGWLAPAGGSGVGFCHSAAVAKALAIRNALMACIVQGFDDIVSESNARMVIMMLKKEVMVDFSIKCILGDIEVLVQKLKSIFFAFVPREGNRAAHSVAKYAFKEGRSFSWDCIGPDFLFNLLAKDVNLSIRL
ncbi:unnamed protein product [Malus baccata var. baccata]